MFRRLRGHFYVWYWRKQREYSRLLYLWPTVPRDCRLKLVMEFLFQPSELLERYKEELKFQTALECRWRKGA